MLDVSYGGNAVAGNFLWKRNRRFGNETGGSDREQHFVTHDRRAYLESGDVSNRLQSPNMWKVKRKTNVYLLFLCAGARCRILFHLPSVPPLGLAWRWWAAQLDRRSHNGVHYSPPPSRFSEGGRCFNQISRPAEAGAAEAGSESDFSPPVFFESETKKDLGDIQERRIRHSKRGQFFWLSRTVRVIRG